MRRIPDSLYVGVVLGFAGCGAQPLLWPEADVEAGGSAFLSVGAAAADITPPGPEFLAGGIPFRLSLSAHDDLWARATVIDDGQHRVALVALDLIGIFYDDVVRIREDVARQAQVDYVLIAATHTHNAPDLLGVWSPLPGCVDSDYRQLVGRQVAAAVAQAIGDLRPAVLRIAAGTSGDPPLTHDVRPPILIDDTLTVWQALDTQTGDVIATSVHYASHPITIPSLNFDVSSDFVDTLRQALESGFEAEEGTVVPQGGVCLFFNGDLGGRITPAHTEPLQAGPPVEPDYEKAQAYGYRLALRCQQLLTDQAQTFAGPLNLSAKSRQVPVAMNNDLFRTAMEFCLVDRAVPEGMVNSEVAIVQVGPLEFFAVPGMIFPELVLGTVEPVDGADFPDVPLEQPSLRDLAAQPYPVTIGLANDMLGYLIPKCLWDGVAPFGTPDGNAPYGEGISPGPDAAATVLRAFADLAANQ